LEVDKIAYYYYQKHIQIIHDHAFLGIIYNNIAMGLRMCNICFSDILHTSFDFPIDGGNSPDAPDMT
jgi:hypothetical protein